MIKKIFCVASLCVLIGCSKITLDNPTDKFLTAQKLSKLENKTLDEISGGAASVSNRGFFWVHNDSGNPANLFLVDQKIKIVLTVTLEGITNRDWEDMAVGPGPEAGKTYLYIGEIGDNKAKFDKKYIYRFEEPTWDTKSKTLRINSFDTLAFELPDKKKDMETLLLDPLSKDIYLITKREEPVWLYRLPYPQSTDTVMIAEKLYSLPYTQIVSGDFSNDGKRILIKNYEHVYYWENQENLSVPELMKQKPFEIPYVLEPQGETIMWARDLSGFYTISEKNVGKDSYLYFYKEKPKK